jgi:phage baseplate assembly protein V
MISAHQAPPFDLSPTELLRRLNNVVRYGTVVEIRYESPARVRVQTGELLTDWLPWSAVRAGDMTIWSAPTVGEQCIVLSPGGDLAQGTVLPAQYSDANPQSSDDPNELHIRWRNGDTLVHNRELGSFALTCQQKITLQVGATVLELTPQRVNVTPDLVAGGISVVHHLHSKVSPGLGRTGEPV